ncbi:MAG: phosphoribosyltransferase [Sumerlaeia bacterium]
MSRQPSRTSTEPAFVDRVDAGRRLSEECHAYGGPETLVLALPRGGVPVGAEVAAELGGTLDVLIVRKVGLPGQRELAMGAVASGGVQITNRAIVRQSGIRPEDFDAAARRELVELERREARYRGKRPFPTLRNRTVILVDDGLATGATMYAATEAVRQLGAEQLVVATPVTSRQARQAIQPHVDDFISLIEPEEFLAVGYWYADFPQVSDQEVMAILEDWQRPQGRATRG